MLNGRKCEFNRSSVTFCGFVFSGKGIAPDPQKVVAIKTGPAPTNSSGVQSFLGMATCCSRFIPKVSDVSEPLRQLTKKDQPFQWLPQHERSFNQIEELLTSAKATAYFDLLASISYSPHTHTAGLIHCSGWVFVAALNKLTSMPTPARLTQKSYSKCLIGEQGLQVWIIITVWSQSCPILYACVSTTRVKQCLWVCVSVFPSVCLLEKNALSRLANIKFL